MFIPMINIIIIKFYYLQIQEYEDIKKNNKEKEDIFLRGKNF